VDRSSDCCLNCIADRPPFGLIAPDGRLRLERQMNFPGLGQNKRQLNASFELGPDYQVMGFNWKTDIEYNISATYHNCQL
ncbi:MAG: hypothetical protein ABIK68_06075, partial [bacterium]